jgi:uncharacterized alpha-E superfamily protein
MISRVAEHCFWLGRYLERAENTARILQVNQQLLLDLEVPLEHQWKPLLIISGIHNLAGEADAETVQTYLTWEEDNRSSILSSLKAARENARIIREVISADMWERINFYYLWLQSPTASKLYERNRSEFYDQIKRINQLIHGIGEATMSHGEPWEFCELGRYLERACQTARILDVKYHVLLPTPQHVGTPVDSAHWVAILTSCSGYEPYHKQRLPIADPAVSVVDFLIYDPLFPRSVRRCLRECQAAARTIAGEPEEKTANAVESGLDELVDWLDRNPIEAIIRSGLHEALTSVVNRIHGIGDAIHKTYFDPAPQTPRLSDRPASSRCTGQLDADPTPRNKKGAEACQCRVDISGR